MKVFILIVAVIVAVNSQTNEQKEKIKEHVKFCSGKIGIPEDEAKNLVYTVITNDKEEYKCFSKCIMEQSGFIDNAGNFQKTVIFDKLTLALGGKDDPEVVKNVNELIEECTAKTGEGPCGTAFEVQNCYWKKIKGH